MKQFLPLQKAMSVLLVLSMVHLCWLTSYGWAEMVGTQEVLNQETQIKITREMLIDALNREDVQDQLEQYGISRVEAAARINSLTDEEVTEIAGKLGQLPNGGYEGILKGLIAGAIVAVFLAFYVLIVIGRGLSCLSDCEAKGGLSYVFRFPSLSGNFEEEPYKNKMVCHIPPENPANFHTIIISDKALSAHLAHGDLSGACDQNAATLCDDGNACTIDEFVAGTTTCAPHEPVSCDDGN